MSDLTYKAIKAAYDDLMRFAPPRQPNLLDSIYQPSRFAGMDVYVEPEVPRLQLREITLSDGTPLVSKEFRDEYNAWLAARFGYREQLCRGDKAYIIGNYGIIVNRQQYAGLITSMSA